MLHLNLYRVCIVYITNSMYKYANLLWLITYGKCKISLYVNSDSNEVT